MNNSKLALIALLGGALTAFGCAEDGGGVTGGTGGGAGGTGGGEEPICNTSPEVPPTLTDACADPTLTNPASCETAETDLPVDHQVTLLVSEKNIDKGFNLDGKNTTGLQCVGGPSAGNDCMTMTDCPMGTCEQVDRSCTQGTLASGADGTNGVDNQVAGLLPLLEDIGSDLQNLDDALEAALCVDPPGTLDLVIRLAASTTADCANAQIVLSDMVVGTCDEDSGDNEGFPCTTNADCTSGAGGS
ncbi:MAG: hypothetical protein JSU89_04655, partial [Myxococcales bacterium]